MRTLIGLALLALASCGANGAPERPGGVTTGVDVTGTVEVGVVGGSR
jgi:hypothetical protein